ncbi:mitochondrial exoribonuclease Cyt-4 [Cordyceps javanica]|uniref:Mitochondrial exoribonuclease Cyt-4 n=1 Tax=Cordyceps javanica TaxID=43265 RepID=A0A545VYX7_9HYPO|nr:mitochondrial exoribonuclease Cyt-4 [Cordyceps javanica]TQW06923.1 mitochondrial exoribonuclease Cyt-4 [Cordyceps javanica]
MLSDANLYGAMSNNMSRTQVSRATNLNNLKAAPAGSQTGSATEFNLGRDEHSIVGTDTSKPGDLVELRTSSSRMPLLAIYLGYYGDRNHFYASNGSWNMSRGFSSLFTVSNFVKPAELEPLLSKLSADATVEDFEKMKEEETGPSREDAKALIEKMDAFRAEAEAVYQRNLANLDAAHKVLSTTSRARYMSLFQMANTLLPESMQVDGEVPAAALYAVHTALARNEFGFQPISSSRALHRRDQLYEVLPLNQTNIVDKVTLLVRQYTIAMSRSTLTGSDAELNKTALAKFLEQARIAVQNSRKIRKVTSFGVLQSSNGGTIPKTEWLPISRDVILFLELWASYGLFESSPRLHSNGTMILRALGAYDDMPLNQATAWTFLQEIGHIMPWEVPSRYKVRFPGTEIVPGGGLRRDEPSIEASRRPDIAAGVRQDITAAVFCIDATTTRVIDDGISVERTDVKDEFWIHIHAADPASGIKPNSELCKYMELIPDNIYLPGHFQAMLPAELGHRDVDYVSKSLVEEYSLQQDCPALTFSAKVNRHGDVLDYKIEPNTLRNVIFMEPEDVSRFCLEPRPKLSRGTELEVGQKRTGSDYVPKRKMVLAKDLDQAQKDDVLLLHELTSAIKNRRLQKGAWPYFFPRPAVSVQFDQTPPTAGADEISIPADPYIHVGMESSNGSALVSNSMVLAGEVAARWCADRQISVPYRRDAYMGAQHEEALAYAQGELYPGIREGIEPSMSQRAVLGRLTGGIELAAEPGPYFLLGLDMYAKATSPLRRFGDLLVHWQVHAALAHERATGRRLDVAADDLDTVLAFSRRQLADTLPLLQLREKLGRAAGRAVSDWMLMAVARALQQQQQQSEALLPERIVFTVDTRLREGLLGHLDLFGLDAIMDVDGLDGRMLVKDVRVADQFEVALSDINVHAGQILVRALRRIGPAAEQQQGDDQGQVCRPAAQ